MMGWVLSYLIKSVSGQLIGSDTIAMFSQVSNGSVLTVVLFIFSVVLGAAIIYKGVGGSIEKANKILMPSIIVILAYLSIRCIMLPGGLTGFNKLFEIDPTYFGKADTWLQALSQSAWSVGPGWGFILVYAIYSPQKQDVALM
ncbi:hypothetical protein SDC9_133622 [bioreactor metagenome]|uniref:Uncharacterized protein n=1 Tax=bioreactor metagenome TaxID=1076179 RepID=A0A645DC72_9ZZZZ